MRIQQLKSLWDSEKEDYKINEIGTGVQNFVKKTLESDELFKLNEGKLKTKREKRKGEFIHEKGTKQRRQADFVIYIDSEIVIPIEVECYTHIEKGIEQLKKYQKDLEKKYGILTDGFLWQFYNNEYIEKEFNIDEILNEPLKFITFWKEYIKPIHYYSAFFEEEVEHKKDLPVENTKESFFDDTTFLIKNIKNKLQIEGYFQNLDDKERNKRATQLAYSYLIQFILYKTLVDNEFDEFLNEYTKNLKLLSKSIKENNYHTIFNIINGISKKISENIYKPFHKEQGTIDEKIKNIAFTPELKLSDISLWLDIFVYIKKYDFRNIRNEIFGFIYENYLKELFEDENKGQYFTDPAVVNFMIEQIGYTPKNIKEKFGKGEEDKLSIIDPSCGSGTFLYTAVDNIVNSIHDGLESSKKIEEIISNNVFGLDIEEFPLYLAEMSILMRLLPIIISKKYNNPFDKKIKLFRTEDSIAEFMDINLNSEVESAVKDGQVTLMYYGQPEEYQSFMRDKNDLEEMKQSLIAHNKIPRRRFDYVIGNPPYISYNDCSKQGLLSFKLIKEKKLKLNNIYGVNLHSIPNNPKKYRPNPNLYAFFIALGLGLLKNKGKLCYIIPQTILINTDFDVIRYHLAKFTTIEKIITFRGKMFIKRGLKQKKEIPTSSLIFIVRKEKPNENNQVEIINYKNIDDELNKVLKNILAGKNITKKMIFNKELMDSLSNWNFIKLDKSIKGILEIYKENSESMDKYYNHSLAKKDFGSLFYFDGGYSIDERKVIDNPKDINKKYFKFPKLDDRFWTIKETSGYWEDIREGKSEQRIELRQGNQGYNILDSKYKLIWSYNNTTKFFFTDLPIIWARNKYLGIGTENKEELEYLFALLNSKITKFLLDNYVKIEQEETRTILVSLQVIKDILRIPKLDSAEKKKFKKEIIKKTDELLNLEDKKLSDFVDFSNILMQKFDSIKLEGSNLILIKGEENIKSKIRGDTTIIKEMIESGFSNKKEINLSSIKNLPIININKQQEIKKDIDNIVYRLYGITKTEQEIIEKS